MKKLYKCRVCGYVVGRKDPPGICPACGVKGKIFEEYESPISEKRRKVLELQIHPVMVHLPIAFVSSMFLINVLRIIGFINDQSVFICMLRAIVLILPFVAIFATLAGMFDGKIRFKRINTPHLKKKLVLACFFILISISLFVIQYFFDLHRSTYNIIILIHSTVLLGIATPLGLIGGKLLESKVRG
jgi:hypothetical protein